MRCRTLICFQLSGFVMLFWCPALLFLEECWHDTGLCDTGHPKNITKRLNQNRLYKYLLSIFHRLTVVWVLLCGFKRGLTHKMCIFWGGVIINSVLCNLSCGLTHTGLANYVQLCNEGIMASTAGLWNKNCPLITAEVRCWYFPSSISNKYYNIIYAQG